MKIGEFVKRYRKANNLSMEAFGQKCGLSRAYISILEKGINPTTGKPFAPTIDTLKSIATVTGTDFNDLLNLIDEDQPVVVNVQPSCSEYYLYPNNCAAGIPFAGEAVKQLPIISIPDLMLGQNARNKNLCFIHANGDSMNKVFPDGALLGFVPADIHDLRNGDIVIFEDENHCIAVKRFFSNGPTLVFKPDSYDSRFYDIIYKADENQIRIIGKVVTYTVNL